MLTAVSTLILSSTAPSPSSYSSSSFARAQQHCSIPKFVLLPLLLMNLSPLSIQALPRWFSYSRVIRRAADAITNLAHENIFIKTQVRMEGGNIHPLIVECNALPTLILMLHSEDVAIHYEAESCFVYYCFNPYLMPIISIFLYSIVARSIITIYAVKTKLISGSLNHVYPFVLVLAALRVKGRQHYYLDNLRQLIWIVSFEKCQLLHWGGWHRRGMDGWVSLRGVLLSITGCTYQSSAPEGCTYQSSAPEGCTYQSSAPEGRTYQSSAPEGRTYQSSAPEGCTYQSCAPEGCTYQSSAPEGCTYPKGSCLQPGLPRNPRTQASTLYYLQGRKVGPHLNPTFKLESDEVTLGNSSNNPYRRLTVNRSGGKKA
ncbi:mucin-3A-like isoform X2 [Cucumis melo var. makuwa]|uniref:Mucin-3A-like isoform X2 n=1 Tax=Cucumis melo var. makuwa TaxID=1194695 RepID=A0A5A7TD99_CUCMM|nr:mucin-3A-like isoform X2 [Cucumis melo var. makuwa]